MLATSRSSRLDEILTALRAVPGFVSVASDDFDSQAINIFLDPVVVAWIGKHNPLKFTTNVGVLKRRVQNALKGVGYRWLDWPAKRYSTSTFRGRTERYDEGYTGNFKLEVFV